MRATCERLGLIWLERETVVLGGVRFIGTTLWSDFDALAEGSPPSQQLKARDKAFRAANFYLRKTLTTRKGEAWLAEGMREQALVCQQWLRHALAQPFDGPTVVVTHFAPSLHSADPRYGMTPGTAGFAMHWTTCCPVRESGCTVICTHPAITFTGAAGWWPTRWGMHAKMSRPRFYQTV